MPTRALTKLRKIALALPEAHEVEAWGAPTFRVKNKLYAMYAAPSNHHGDGRESVWVKARAGNQEMMVRAAPKKFFVPAYVGPNGWVGVYLDANVDWDELAELLRDGYCMTAPKKLLATLDAPAAPPAKRTPKKKAAKTKPKKK